VGANSAYKTAINQKEKLIMKITREMKIKDVLAIDEDKMIETLMWMAPEFERLRFTRLRRAMSGRVSVEQAARVARIPLTEMLYVLNLAAGEDEAKLALELQTSDWKDFEFRETNPPLKPLELINTKDTDSNVSFVDLMPFHEARCDPMPAIAKALIELKNTTDILLLKHPFDPIPLRDMLATRKGFASWAEERNENVWFIYFYRPAAVAHAVAHPPINNKIYLKAFAAAATV
jgi:hypothetical protein